MKFGIRKPSLPKATARTSVKRFVPRNPGFKASRGSDWLIQRKKIAYNRARARTSASLGFALRNLFQ